jgi:hypothetical protein|tara:strand:- start:236 stop:631 length:396 start_codon:yes stop_codon:yes gene_type:complete
MVFNSNLFSMKTVYTKLLFLSIFLYSISSFSQANLQFNTVVNIGGPLGNYATGPTITVPSGKIWKVVSYSQFNGLWLNGYNIYDLDKAVVGQAVALAKNAAPLWLNEGDSFYFTTGNASHPWFMSILEFNR